MIKEVFEDKVGAADFLEKARKTVSEPPAIENPDKILIDRNIVEIVAARVVVIDDASGGKKAR